MPVLCGGNSRCDIRFSSKRKRKAGQDDWRPLGLAHY
jgi:hypothetical protein